MDDQEKRARWGQYFAANPLPFALFKFSGPAGNGRKAVLWYGNPALAKLLKLPLQALENVEFTANMPPSPVPGLFRMEGGTDSNDICQSGLAFTQEELLAWGGRVADTGISTNLFFFCSQQKKYVRATLYQPEPEFCGCFLLDITGEINNHAELEEKQREINTLLSALPGGLFKYEAVRGGQFTFISEQMLKALGYTEAEFKAKFNNCFDDMVYAEDREKVLESIDNQMQDSDFDSCEYRIETKSGALKWFYDVGHRVTDANGKQWFYVVIVDIDDRKHLEAEKEKREKLQSELLAAETASRAKSMFLSNASHDMRTPLNGVIGYTELALVTEDRNRMLDYLRKIQDSSRILLELIQDTLDLSTIETGNYVLRKETVDSNEVVRGVETAIRPMAEAKGLSLNLDRSKAYNGCLNLDMHRVQEVLLNLLNNAVKFTSAGGRIELIIECLRVEDKIIHDRFVIRDNGCGISEGFLPQIFEPFTQEHNWNAENISGTGLGLPIVKRLVELMGGRIEVKSVVNKGTEFTVYLDFERSEACPLSREETRLNFGKLSGKRVLLCEDHPLNVDIAVKLLERQQMQVVVARNGKEGRDIFSQSASNFFDVILMDVRMPVLDGLEATKVIRKLERDDAKTIPILGMSANAYKEDYERAWKAGMNDYIAKPVMPMVLYQTLVRWL